MPELKKDCGLCYIPEKYRDLTIAEFDLWKCNLHESQVYPGRSLIILKRHVEDIFDITREEKRELEVIIRGFKRAVGEVFCTDMFNYAALGNTVRHAHLHFIPRYSHPLEYGGVIFEDRNQGQNYAPYDKNFLVPKPVLLGIRDLIRDRL